jgi:hypothetical protein
LSGNRQYEYITGPPPQLTESFSEQTIIKDLTLGQPKGTDPHTHDPANQSDIDPIDAENFLRRLDHAAREPEPERWSNIRDLLDGCTLQVEDIPEELFAPETMELPPSTRWLITTWQIAKLFWPCLSVDIIAS